MGEGSILRQSGGLEEAGGKPVEETDVKDGCAFRPTENIWPELLSNGPVRARASTASATDARPSRTITGTRGTTLPDPAPKALRYEKHRNH